MEAYRRHHNIKGNPPFYLVPDALDLIADHDALIASIRATLGDIKPSVVTLDTLNRSLAGNENDPGDMTLLITQRAEARRAEGGRVICIWTSV